VGYVLLVPGRPRLEEARPVVLRRSGVVDWPAFLEVMTGAVEAGEEPFAAAGRLAGRLMREERIDLGLPEEGALARACGLWLPTERAAFARRAEPEMRNSRGEWEVVPKRERMMMGECRVWVGERWRPVLQVPERLAVNRWGTLVRLRKDRKWWYGLRWTLATGGAGNRWRAVKPLRRMAVERGPEGDARMRSLHGLEDWVRLGVEWLGPFLAGAKTSGSEEEGRLVLQVDFAESLLEAYRDRHGVGLVNPPTRVVPPPCCAGCPEEVDCVSRPIKVGAAHCWRQLGLVEADGTPTRRGRIFGWFQGGEGLAIAAGLEAEDLDLESLLYELADVRGGRRFGETSYAGEGRLAGICRAVYGWRDVSGYLEGGLPLDYGAGAGYAVRCWLEEPRRTAQLLEEGVRMGDLERALSEWRGLLRQIAAGPEDGWERWEALQRLARRTIGQLPEVDPLELTELTAAQMRVMEHRLR